MQQQALDEVLAQKPGDGVCIDQFGSQLRIKIQGHYAWDKRAIGSLAAIGCGGFIVIWVGLFVLLPLVNLPMVWKQILPVLPIVIPLSVGMTRFLGGAIPANLRIDPEGCRSSSGLIYDTLRGRMLDLPPKPRMRFAIRG